MWAKIFVLIAVTTTSVRINGLQNDLDIGYSYSHPYKSLSSPVRASLAYYVNIPANSDAGQHFYVISTPGGRQMPPQDSGGNFVNHGLRQFPPQYSQPNHNAISAFSQQTIDPRPSYSIQNHARRPSPSSNSFHQLTHQADPRNSVQSRATGSGYIIQKSIVENVQQNTFTNFADQTHGRSPTVSREIAPQPYAPHVSVQIEPKTHQRSMQKQYRLVPSMASIPMSYDAQLPFPIGVVPIKFRAFPLKTHLQQGLLLPITSYQARDTYMK